MILDDIQGHTPHPRDITDSNISHFRRIQIRFEFYAGESIRGKL